MLMLPAQIWKEGDLAVVALQDTQEMDFNV